MGSTTNDVLDMLLARLAQSKLTRQQITTFLTDMFIAASDTSTVTVQRALAQLLRHPEKMEKLRAELVARLGFNEFIKATDLDDLPYLQAVVKETLRLHPAVPLIPREVVADGVSLGGFPVPIGRDEKAWPQPEEFVPEGFLGVSVYTAHSVPLLLASLPHKMEWKLPEGMGPDDIDLSDRYGTVLDLATPLRAVPVSAA
ncbi:hypothetical protein PR202_gb07619 [Eleusine coracana subsp. coracana]|uniref:Cytochrome P450 n=1 Tax=Eleusine coracana subsp. coracana TaxID=191504 RepID=A0AAV5EA55_ELECO|nr:hypothetical protein PR202_gb07619 [Eleusine coracana subsp. coracana]